MTRCHACCRMSLPILVALGGTICCAAFVATDAEEAPQTTAAPAAPRLDRGA